MQLFEHFGLHQNPFHISPDTNFFFSTVAHDHALTQLVAGIKNRVGFMLLTGDPGTGKTTVIHYLLDWLRRHDYSSAYVFHSLLTSTDLLEFILRDLDVPFTPGAKSDMRAALHRWLLARRDVGDRPVIIIDEAQDLSRSALKELYRLLHLEKHPGDLVQVILAGQLPINEKLREPELIRLRRCLRCRCRLTTLTLEETSSFIFSRLQKAGAGNVDVFPADAVHLIHGYARGTPRIINTLCEHALLEALAMGCAAVAPEHILEVARRLDLAEPDPAGLPAPPNTFGRLIRFPVPSVSPPGESTETIETPSELIQLPLLGAPVSTSPALLIANQTANRSKKRNFWRAGLSRSSALLSAAAKSVRVFTQKVADTAHHLWMASGSWQNSVSPAARSLLMVYWRAVRQSLIHDTQHLFQVLSSRRLSVHRGPVGDVPVIHYWPSVRQSLARDFRRFRNSVSYWWPARARNTKRNPLPPSVQGPIAITKTAHQPVSARGRRRLPTSTAASKGA